MPNLEIATSPNTVTSPNVTTLEKNLAPRDTFINRHIAPNQAEITKMLELLGINSLEDFITKTVPSAIRLQNPLKLPPRESEYAALAQLKSIASKNQIFRSYIGMGYYDTITPPVIKIRPMPSLSRTSAIPKPLK